MKKGLLVVTLFTIIYSCNNSNKKATEETKVEVPVENVNGNVPDTTNSIGLDTHTKDTFKVKDSSKK